MTRSDALAAAIKLLVKAENATQEYAGKYITIADRYLAIATGEHHPED
jgi:hypothetical protein